MKLSKRNKVITILLIGLVPAGGDFHTSENDAAKKKTNIIKILPDEADMRISDFVYTEVGPERHPLGSEGKKRSISKEAESCAV